MAESKSAALPLGYAPTGRNEGRIDPVDRLRQRPVYRGSCAISTGRTAEFRAKSGPFARHSIYVISPGCPRGGFHPLGGRPNTAIGELRPPRFRGKTAVA